MNQQSLKRAALAAVVFLVSGSSWAAERGGGSAPAQTQTSLACTDLSGALAAAAQEAGIPINAAQASTTTSDLLVFSAATVEGLERVPATQYAHGVDVAFVYLDSPDSNIPAGYYLLRASAKASDIKVGTYSGSVGFFNTAGVEVARSSATFETISVTNPDPGASIPARVAVRGDLSAGSLRRLLMRAVAIIWTPSGYIVIHAYNGMD
ncbi:hypothetical protein [Myxococcus stipitatus]|uniref:hypothetical protein n=1 Tax=Myxococcus stipitatus TaxID=83455 RepID=UPI0030CCE380